MMKNVCNGHANQPRDKTPAFHPESVAADGLAPACARPSRRSSRARSSLAPAHYSRARDGPEPLISICASPGAVLLPLNKLTRNPST